MNPDLDAILDAIRQRAEAATPGPWIAGDPWRVDAVGFRNRGPDECAYCYLGPPVWVGRCDINGEVMQAHRHRSPAAYAPGHVITSADGYTVAGESGGIVDPADAEFIRHAREDIPALLAEVAELRTLLDYARRSRFEYEKRVSEQVEDAAAKAATR